MTIVLKHQVEASENAAVEIESAIRAGPRPDRERDLENLRDEVALLMRLVILLHEQANRGVTSWQDDPASDAEDPSGEQWRTLYHQLNSVFRRVFSVVKNLENRGQEFQQKQEFLSSWRDLRSSLCFSADRVSAAIQQLRRGEVRPLDEVARELWD